MDKEGVKYVIDVTVLSRRTGFFYCVGLADIKCEFDVKSSQYTEEGAAWKYNWNFWSDGHLWDILGNYRVDTPLEYVEQGPEFIWDCGDVIGVVVNFNHNLKCKQSGKDHVSTITFLKNEKVMVIVPIPTDSVLYLVTYMYCKGDSLRIKLCKPDKYDEQIKAFT
jgi:hypothetical protein